MHGLFHHDHAPPQIAEFRVRRRLFPKFAEVPVIAEIFVAIEGDEKIAVRRVAQQAGQVVQPRQIPRGISEQFHFEIAQTVGADATLQILRQPVVHPLTRGEVGWRQRIAEADRMPHEATGQRCGGQPVLRRRSAEFGIDLPQPQPQPIFRHEPMQRLLREPAQAIQHRALDEAHAEIGQQRCERPGLCPLALLPIQFAPEVEKRHRS